MSATCSATYNAYFFLSEIRMSDTPARSSFRSEPPSRSLPVHSVIRPRSHRGFWGKRDFNCVKVCQKPGGLSNQRGHRVIMAAHAEHPVPTYPGGLRACATDSLARCQLFGRHSPWGLRERSQQVATLPAELFRSEIARRHAGTRAVRASAVLNTEGSISAPRAEGGAGTSRAKPSSNGDSPLGSVPTSVLQPLLKGGITTASTSESTGNGH